MQITKMEIKIRDDLDKRWEQYDRGWEKEIVRLLDCVEEHDYNPMDVRSKFKELVVDIYVTAWQDGFTAKLSGVSDDDR